MGALRRHQDEDRLPPPEEASGLDYSRAPPVKPYPRWLVVTGLLTYCAVFWAVIWAVSDWGVSLVRVALAGGPE